MKIKKHVTPQISVITYDSPSGELYELYINGKWEQGYTSLSELIRDIQAIINNEYES